MKFSSKIGLWLLPFLLLPALALAAPNPPDPLATSSPTVTCDGEFKASELFTVKDSLLPPFLRTADAAQSADFSCIGAGIRFYTDFLALIVAFTAFLYMLYGGFLYMTAFGDDAKATSAKKVITQAIIGLVLATLAFSIISIVNTALNAGATLPQ